MGPDLTITPEFILQMIRILMLIAGGVVTTYQYLHLDETITTQEGRETLFIRWWVPLFNLLALVSVIANDIFPWEFFPWVTISFFAIALLSLMTRSECFDSEKSSELTLIGLGNFLAAVTLCTMMFLWPSLIEFIKQR